MYNYGLVGVKELELVRTVHGSYRDTKFLYFK